MAFADQRGNTGITSVPGLPDYNLYAASLAAATGASPNMSFGIGGAPGAGQGASSGASVPGAGFAFMNSSNPQQQQQTHTLPGTSAPMQFPPFATAQQQQQQGQPSSSNPHQRAMSALAGLGQGIAGGASGLPTQPFGHQTPSGLVGSNSAPNTTQTGAAPSPQFGMVGPAGFQPGSPTSQSLLQNNNSNTSPFANTGPGDGVHQAMNIGQNATSPAAQAMSAMSSMSGIPSSNTSASANTPISPATAYTPNFASPSLSQQAAFNAAAAAGLGVNFGAFGMPNCRSFSHKGYLIAGKVADCPCSHLQCRSVALVLHLYR